MDLKRNKNPVLRMKPRQPKIPARALTDADIQNLPNYVAAEWEKPDNLLVAQRRAMSALASEFVRKIDPQVLPQEIIPDFNDDDNITKDSSQGNPNPLLSVRFRFIQMDVIGGGLAIPIYSFTRPYSDYFNSNAMQNF